MVNKTERTENRMISVYEAQSHRSALYNTDRHFILVLVRHARYVRYESARSLQCTTYARTARRQRGPPVVDFAQKKFKR
eukprot:765948-Hanusia_phi.AAC.2